MISIDSQTTRFSSALNSKERFRVKLSPSLDTRAVIIKILQYFHFQFFRFVNFSHTRFSNIYRKKKNEKNKHFCTLLFVGYRS